MKEPDPPEVVDITPDEIHVIEARAKDLRPKKQKPPKHLNVIKPGTHLNRHQRRAIVTWNRLHPNDPIKIPDEMRDKEQG